MVRSICQNITQVITSLKKKTPLFSHLMSYAVKTFITNNSSEEVTDSAWRDKCLVATSVPRLCTMSMRAQFPALGYLMRIRDFPIPIFPS